MASDTDMSNTIYDFYDSECVELFEFLEISVKELTVNPNKWESVITDHIKRIRGRTVSWTIKSFGENLVWLNTSVPLRLDHELKDKVIVLDFFTYCCINCEHVLPLIQQVEEKCKANPELVFIGIHSPKHPNEKDVDSVRDAIKRNKIMHPVINDSENNLWKTLNINCWPTVLIIGPDHKVLFSLIGEIAIEKLDFICQLTLQYFHTNGVHLNTTLLPVEYEKILDEKKTLLYPSGISCSNASLVVSDTGHNRLLLMTFDGKVLDIIGDGSKGYVDGCFKKCSFNSPHGTAWLGEDIIFVADTGNNCIRLIDLIRKTVFTVFSGNENCVNSGTSSSDQDSANKEAIDKFKSPWDICIGPNIRGPVIVCIAVAGSHQIWALYLEEDSLLTRQFSGLKCFSFAGNGKEECRNNFYSKNAGFAQPSGICYSELGFYFIVDSESSSLRSLSHPHGSVQTVVGGSRNPSDLFSFGDMDGKGPCVKFQHPLSICVLNRSNVLITDSYNHKIKLIDVELKMSSTFAGTGVKGDISNISKLEAEFNEPSGICYSQNIGCALIADTNNHCVKLIDLKEELVKTVAITFPTTTCVDGPVSKKLECNSHYQKIKLKSGGKLSCTFLLIQQGMSLTEGAPQPWTVTLDGKCNWSVSCLSNTIVNMNNKPSLVFQCENNNSEKYSTINIKVDFSACNELKKVCVPKHESVKIDVQFCETGSEVSNAIFYF